MRVDALGPRIESIVTQQSPSSSNHLYSGTITIAFDKVLYVRTSKGNNAVYAPGNTTDAYSSEGPCSIMKATLKTLFIKFDQIPAGSIIEISPHGQEDEDKKIDAGPFLGENGYASQLDPIRLLLKETVNKDGTSTLQFVISAPGKDCDGKTSEITPS